MAMRFLLYNIRYGTGRRTRWAWMHYLTRTISHLPEIARFIREMDPDVVGLVEVDAGSYRSGRRNQAEFLAGAAAVAGTLAGGLAACGDKRDTGPTTFRCD